MESPNVRLCKRKQLVGLDISTWELYQTARWYDGTLEIGERSKHGAMNTKTGHRFTLNRTVVTCKKSFYDGQRGRSVDLLLRGALAEHAVKGVHLVATMLERVRVLDLGL